MKRPSRDTWLALSLCLILAAITAAAAISQTRAAAQLPPLSIRSAQPDGALALALWLEREGYYADGTAGLNFEVPEFARVVLLLEPTTFILEREWQTLDEWVEDGGLLVVAGSQLGALAALEHFDVSLTIAGSAVEALAPASPLLASPPAEAPAVVQAEYYLENTGADFAVLMAAADGPLIVTRPQGRGRIILSAAAYPFTNAGLKAAGNGELVLSLISVVPRRGWVWFDEWHHGERGLTGEPAAGLSGPADWLRFTPAGRALLYVAVVVFVALLLSGRRFGRPSLLPHEAARRTPLEYVTAIASLSRRAGHRAALLQQYRQQLKRQLGARYRLDPTLDDDSYVKRLAGYAPGLDAAALGRLLARLRAPRVGEAEMVALAAETAQWTKEQS